MLHYEPSRIRHESEHHAPRSPIWWRGRGDEPPLLATPADLVVWPLVVLVFLLGLHAAPIFAPERCTNEALSWAQDETVQWSGADTSAWPPTSRCTLTDAHGRAEVLEYRSWQAAVGYVLAVAIFAVGLARPPSWGWRRAAHVMTVPLLVGASGFVHLATGASDGAIPALALGAGVLATVSLVPAVLTATVVVLALGTPPGRAFTASWLGWALGLVAVVGLVAAT